MNTQDPQAKAGAAKAKPEVIKLGLDLHARQVMTYSPTHGFTRAASVANGESSP
jgi:hypothetical protein